MIKTILNVKNLTISVANTVLIDDISFAIAHGETVALIGESGSGKSLTALAISDLLPPSLTRYAKDIRLDENSIYDVDASDMQHIRGGKIGFIFQDPLQSLHPSFSIGEQISEACRCQLPIGRAEAMNRAITLLEQLGFRHAKQTALQFPHQLSGGMRQRVMIAIALAADPDLLIADEPTSALDCVTQNELLVLLKRIQNERQLAILFITHDIGVAKQISGRMMVMYAGKIVEIGPQHDVLNAPIHPYTQALLNTIPHANNEWRPQGIDGVVPAPESRAPGCSFFERCPRSQKKCQTTVLKLNNNLHHAACIYDQIEPY